MVVKPVTGTFTVDEYHRLGELGVFHEDDRVELLEGQVIVMTPIGRAHVACVIRLTHLLASPTVAVSVQNPLVLADRSEPEPDIVVLRPTSLTADALPTWQDALLVIEVADTSLAHDRDTKIPLYARAGIPEAWLVDLAADCIEVYQNPGPDGYADLALVARGAILAPLALPTIRLEASDILG